jgi:hypothetical protein
MVLQTKDYLQAEKEATTEALANMVTAIMPADRTTMGQLTNAITDLTSQHSSRDNKIASLKTRLCGNTSGTNNNREGGQSTMWSNGKH